MKYSTVLLKKGTVAKLHDLKHQLKFRSLEATIIYLVDGVIRKRKR